MLTPQIAMSFGYFFALAIAAFGASIGLGLALKGAMEAMGRQPEAIDKIQIPLIIGLAFIEAIAIYGLISIFIATSAIQ